MINFKGSLTGMLLMAATGCSVSAHAAFDQLTLKSQFETLENKSGGRLGVTVFDTSDGSEY